ncbi:MAG: V4R domain-containing protein [Candidatus Altiarchaeota archaeon]
MANNEKLKVDESLLPNLQLTGEKIVGVAFRRIIIEACKLTGEKIAEKILTGANYEEKLRNIEHYFKECGFGDLKIDEFSFEEKKAKIKLLNSIFPKYYANTKSKGTVCYAIVGLLLGIFSKIFMTEVECKEVKCVANNDPNCEFILLTKGAINRLEDWIKNF